MAVHFLHTILNEYHPSFLHQTLFHFPFIDSVALHRTYEHLGNVFQLKYSIN